MMNTEALTSVLLLASVLTVISTALTQAIKVSLNVPKNILTLVSIVVGAIVGLLASPLTDFDWTIRVWAGVLGGLAGTGLYELPKNNQGTTKKEE